MKRWNRVVGKGCRKQEKCFLYKNNSEYCKERNKKESGSQTGNHPDLWFLGLRKYRDTTVMQAMLL